MSCEMKTFLILVSFEFLKTLMSSPVYRAGSSPSQALKPNIKQLHGQHGQQLSLNQESANTVRPLLTKPKPAILSNSEVEQDSMLERTSPEYNDEFDKNVANMKEGMPQRLKLTQDFPIEDSLASVEHENTGRNMGRMGMGPGPMGVLPSGNTLEELNMMLKNTLPEYQYDRAANGYTFPACDDLDPDCRRYEMQGLCSDNPDFAFKRFNCKKTCHLCPRRFGDVKLRKDHY